MEQLKRYESYTIHEAVEKLAKFKFVLPSFQRRIVWNDRQIRDLFDTIINNNLFGSVSAIKQQLTGDFLFEYYKDFDISGGRRISEPSDNRVGILPPIYYIIDGQQRLSVLYSVLTGLKKLFFDVEKCEFLLPANKNGSCVEVKTLYSALEQGSPDSYIKYCEQLGYDELRQENVFKFYYSFFFNRSINVSLVFAESDNKEKTKKRFIDLFVKLNTGGTNLTPADVALCTLKGYYVNFEEIIDLVYQFGKETYYDFPRVFFDSLVLFKYKSKDPNDDYNAEIDYQELYTIDPITQESEIESESSKEEEFDIFNSRIIKLYYSKIEEYKDNLLDFQFLINSVESIKIIVKKTIQIIKDIFNKENLNSDERKINKTLLGYVLPIIMARLYYSNDIYYARIISKLDGYKVCNKLMLKDLTSINKIDIDSFYTGGEL